MESYHNMIERVSEIICGHTANGKNYMLVGDNSSGKSEILRKVVEKKLEQTEEVYFIDSVNRTFDIDKVELVSKAYRNVKLDSNDVVAERLMPFHFNLRDTFKAMSCIEQLYDKYSEKIVSMCHDFLGKNLQIVREHLEAGIEENRVFIDGEAVSLSSGYQAIIRIFCEILFFCDVMEDQKWSRGFLVIDEIDENLSPKYSAEIFNFLQKSFPKLNFLVATHALDLVKCTENAELIVLKEQSYEIYTSEEMKGSVLPEDIFVDLFFENQKIEQSDNDETDHKLRMLLNLKIAELWDEKAEKELRELNLRDMKPHQKMIYKQIEEW